MGFEIRYTSDQPPSDADILKMLRAQYPDKNFAVQGNTIVESYRTQPSYTEMLERSPRKRAANAAGVRAVATAEIDAPVSYVERTMSSQL
jgi:hypothetical protein